MLSRRGFVRSSLAAAVAASLPAGQAFSAILGPSAKVDRDIDAVTGTGKAVTLTRAMVQELGDSLRGNLLLAGHPAYEEARRVINAQMDKHPALIVQPRGAADVKQAVDFARASNLLVAVKCGGHSPSGKSTCDRGMIIDLSLMRNVRVDSKAAHRARRGRQPARRHGQRDDGARPRDDRGHGVAHRRRRPHARRRLRPRRAALRARARQREAASTW